MPIPGRRNAEAGWGRWFRQIEGTADQGQVLMEGPEGTPLMVLNRVEDGRVAEVMSDQVWLWARGYDGGGPHAEMIRRLAHWLMKEPDLEEEALRAEARDGQLTIERRSLETEPVSVTVTAPDGTTRTLTLTADGRRPGHRHPADRRARPLSGRGRDAYRARRRRPAERPRTGRSADHRRTPADPGFGDRRQRPLDRGRHPVGAADAARPGRRGGATGSGCGRNDAHVVTGILQVPLLPWWLVLPLGLGLFAAAWWREGR